MVVRTSSYKKKRGGWLLQGWLKKVRSWPAGVISMVRSLHSSKRLSLTRTWLLIREKKHGGWLLQGWLTKVWSWQSKVQSERQWQLLRQRRQAIRI